MMLSHIAGGRNLRYGVDPRLRTIERCVGVPILCGGIFRTRLDRSSATHF